tara:strand:+ start:3652 stop:3966 length:315 start_codon:yes stop_codon:yes gene_type:complete
MKKIEKLLLFLTLTFFLYSCGGASDAAKVLRNEKITNTDEFFVKKRDPLILPPDYNTLPEPNTVGKSKKNSRDKIGKILKLPEDETSVSGTSSVEESILKNIKK